MKIVHLIPALTKGGAERVVVELANQAAREGHDVAVVAATTAPPELLADQLLPQVAYVAISPPERGRLAWYGAGIAWGWRNRAMLAASDVVHCHLTFASLAGTLLGWWRNLTGRARPLIVETIHAVGMPITSEQRRRLAFFARRRNGVALMARDPFWEAFAAKNAAIPVAVIPNGIALPRMQPAGSRNHVRRSLGIPEDALVVGTIGRMVAERMPEALLAAFAAAPATIGAKPVHLVLGGAGPLVDPLCAEAIRCGIRRRVHFPGLVADPAQMLCAFDLYLSVNVGEITGIAGLESAAAGLPVVAFQALAGRAAEPEDWIWSSNDRKELGDRIAEILGNPDTAAAMAARQKQHVRDHHGAAGMLRAYMELYQAAGAQGGVTDVATTARHD